MSLPGRVASLDAFRGFAIAAMILVNNPGSWEHVYGPLDHAAWNGCTFTDLIFPFFLVAAGLSLAISLSARAREDRSGGALYLTLLRRAAVIFFIGVALNAIPAFQLATLRIPGVLQRIALALALAAPVVIWGRNRGVVLAILLLFGVYLVFMLGLPVRGADGLVAAGRLTPGMDAGARLDRLVFGAHLWARARTWDPEGLLGTLPATANVLFGVLAARRLRAPAGRWPKSLGLLAAALILLALGGLVSRLGLPLNKNLWTPSFAVFTTGWALLFLAGFHLLLDEGPPMLTAAGRRLCLPLTIYGMNALFLFVASGLVARLLQAVPLSGQTLKAWLFGALARLPLSPLNASLLFAVLFDLAMFAVAWVMWRKQWFVKV